MEKKKIIGGIQEKRCRMIGIAGSNVGVGCTHFSIMLANYLTGYLRRKAILLEFNESGDFERLEQVCTGQTGRKNPYRILDADYYKQLPTKKNDDHGTGIVMMAAVEMMKINI